MKNKQSGSSFSEIPDSEITMMAAEELLGSIFEDADDDSQYHKNIETVKNEVTHGKCSCDAADIAESILAWSGAL